MEVDQRVKVWEQLVVVHAVISHPCQLGPIQTMASLRTSHNHTLDKTTIPSRRCCSAQISKRGNQGRCRYLQSIAQLLRQQRQQPVDGERSSWS